MSIWKEATSRQHKWYAGIDLHAIDMFLQAALLDQNYDDLLINLATYKPPSAANEAIIRSGKIKYKRSEVTLDQKQITFVLELSKKLV